MGEFPERVVVPEPVRNCTAVTRHGVYSNIAPYSRDLFAGSVSHAKAREVFARESLKIVSQMLLRSVYSLLYQLVPLSILASLAQVSIENEKCYWSPSIGTRTETTDIRQSSENVIRREHMDLLQFKNEAEICTKSSFPLWIWKNCS